jgi:hypothetical protein
LPSIPQFRLEFEDELSAFQESKAADLSHERELLRQYEETSGSAVALASAVNSASGGDWDGEVYEKQGVDNDKAFVRFQKTLSWAPQQVVRYYQSASDAPLRFTQVSPKSDEDNADPEPVGTAPRDNNRDAVVGLKTCDQCGSGRLVEMQVLPTLLSVADGVVGKHLDFGIVSILSCEDSCCPSPGDGVTLIEEAAVVEANV